MDCTHVNMIFRTSVLTMFSGATCSGTCEVRITTHLSGKSLREASCSRASRQRMRATTSGSPSKARVTGSPPPTCGLDSSPPGSRFPHLPQEWNGTFHKSIHKILLIRNILRERMSRHPCACHMEHRKFMKRLQKRRMERAAAQCRCTIFERGNLR